MRKRHTEGQIIANLKEHVAGPKTADRPHARAPDGLVADTSISTTSWPIH
jgi:hypothetical protein